ncbi:MAG: DNA translocase FtsK, partial [Candidatus Parcubacteria bacterium]|nr:DNA translocase FtsK [Candidatus Parcubacteria bacterium]
AYVSDKELRKVVKFITSHQTKVPEGQVETTLEDELSKSVSETMSKDNNFDSWSADEDPLYEEAKNVVIESKKASASLLQRRLRVGYARAARLIDILENKGIVGPGEGAKPREIYSQDQENRENDIA